MQPLENFRDKKGGLYGKEARCKTCRAEWYKKYCQLEETKKMRQGINARRVARRLEILEKNGYNEVNTQTKTCTKCNQVKVLSEFNVLMSARDHLNPRCRDCIRAIARERLRSIKREVIDQYGGKCQCPDCGENRIQFLSIEHINGGGHKHRKEMKRASIYVWLKENNYPKDGFEILCFNCNLARGFFGYCHKEPALAAA